MNPTDALCRSQLTYTLAARTRSRFILDLAPGWPCASVCVAATQFSCNCHYLLICSRGREVSQVSCYHASRWTCLPFASARCSVSATASFSFPSGMPSCSPHRDFVLALALFTLVVVESYPSMCCWLQCRCSHAFRLSSLQLAFMFASLWRIITARPHNNVLFYFANLWEWCVPLFDSLG